MPEEELVVTARRRIYTRRSEINASTVLSCGRKGLTSIDEGGLIERIVQCDIDYIDLEQMTLQTIDNPFGARLSPMP